MSCAAQAMMLSANSATAASSPTTLFFSNRNPNHYPNKNHRLNHFRIRASSDDSDCNAEECAPDKEIDDVAEAEREDRGSPELVQSHRGRGGGPEKEGGQHGGGPEDSERRVTECNGRYVIIMASLRRVTYRNGRYSRDLNFSVTNGRRMKDILMQQGVSKALLGKEKKPKKIKEEDWEDLDAKAASVIHLKPRRLSYLQRAR
ncbi:importin alpha isoform 6 [Actinidia rufa]|uniref:Importin alpha isoform 6 n=1 Tax=Actinidia rufa TaxID=165716 RepID=A0A7J0DNM3_9ERIC|nr:importin alpha isoform 6 [Actinidia rufa]